jgi:hypothetical protein
MTKTALVIFLVLVSIPVSIVLNGLALSYLWLWFVVSPFGLPVLSVAQAVGLAALIRFTTYQDMDVMQNKRTSSERLSRAIFLAIGAPLFALLFGYIISCFV